MKENAVYWVWIQQALRYNNRKIKYIIDLYKDIERFYVSGENEWRLSGILTNKDIDNLRNLNIERAKIIVENCKKIGCDIVALDDERFPYLLKQISDPPAVLYVKGDITCVSGKLTIAIVGTRKASDYGFSMASGISKSLAENGVVVVSGGALGIDSVAHEGAVNAGEKTVCVLGCGIDYPYLISKRALKQDIIKKGGAIITEYSPGTPARAWTFPARNRIISGISHGTVVVEAGEKSGSLITANLANEQNRDVYVVALPKQNPGSSGNLALINDGAQVIMSANDVLKEYSSQRMFGTDSSHSLFALSKKQHEFSSGKSVNGANKELVPKKEITETDPKIETLSEEERKIYEVISKGKIQINSIVEKTGLPSHKILSMLTNLELLGLAKSFPGKYYEVI